MRSTLSKEMEDLCNAASLVEATRAADALVRGLDLSGYKFCVASALEQQLVVIAVLSGGDLSVADDLLSGQRLDDPEDPLARTYWTQEPVLWSTYLAMEGTSTRRSLLQALGVSCGASIPIMSRTGRKRASLCVTGAPDETAEAFDQRFALLAPTLRLAGLAMLEFGFEIARQRASTRLTPTEAKVLELLAIGRRPREIADAMSKSESTVRNQIVSAREKLGADSALHAVALWTMRAP